MTRDIDSNRVLPQNEREELVLDLHFNQEKNYHEIFNIFYKYYRVTHRVELSCPVVMT